MATADYWNAADLDAVAHGGLIHEDVMDQIFDISNIPLDFADMAGSGSMSKSYTEWTQDRLAAPDLTNAQVDGRDSSGNDAKGGKRVGNHGQISTKDVIISTRAQKSDTIGRANELAYQVMERQKELRRDVDAIAVSSQASIADDGDSVPGKSGALGAWLETNVSFGATGSAGGFDSGIVDAPTFGTARALTFTLIKDMAQLIWVGGGNPTKVMSVPTVMRKLSEYMFTSTAQIATLTSETGQKLSESAAKGSVNVMLTDFGVTMDFVPNRLQQLENTDAQANLYILDPQYLELKYLHRYMVEPLAKAGLADKRLMSVDWTLAVLNEEAHGLIADVDPAEAVVT